MQKKVVFVNLRLTGGGSERVLSMIANYYAEQGIDTQMILLSDEPRVYPISDKVKIIECYCPMKGNKLIWHVKRILSIRKAIKASDSDTVISFMWDINMKVILACLGLGKKIIISERADPVSSNRRKSFDIACKWIFPKADTIVFQTEQVQSYYPINQKQKSIVIPNPVSTKASKFTGKRDKKIVAIGRLLPQKNFEMLLNAFHIFHESHKDYILEIYGEGIEKDKLSKLAHDLKISEYVKFKGFVPNIEEEIKNAMIYASSSNYEGISNAMLEALALGIPAVCTDCPVGGAAMVIKNRENGILVPVNDYIAMAKSFNELADNSDLLESISKKAKEVSEIYSIENIGRMWIEL